jgi:hypothetical protein
VVNVPESGVRLLVRDLAVSRIHSRKEVKKGVNLLSIPVSSA